MTTIAHRPLVAVTANSAGSGLTPYLDAIERAGAEAWPLVAGYALTSDEVLARVGALVLADGPDVNPTRYGKSPHPSEAAPDTYDNPRDEMEIALAGDALDADLPIYGIGRGMHILNIALGGTLVQKVEGHSTEPAGGVSRPAHHHIYISPGSKLAAVVGSGGFVRVNSLHRAGMREAQKSPHLLASAYSLQDGLIEALESANHRWVIAVQFSPQRRMEIPPHFDRLFQSLAERAAERLG